MQLEMNAGNRHSRDRGFTLLELLIVVFVITLVMALSYPALSRGSTSLHLRSAGRDVLNVFRYARERAVTEQVRMKVTLDPAVQQVQLSDELGAGSRSYSLPRDVRIHALVFAGEAVAEGPIVVRYLPNGSSESAEVVLRAETGASLRVITDPITGGARIEAGTGGNAR